MMFDVSFFNSLSLTTDVLIDGNKAGGSVIQTPPLLVLGFLWPNSKAPGKAWLQTVGDIHLQCSSFLVKAFIQPLMFSCFTLLNITVFLFLSIQDVGKKKNRPGATRKYCY